MVQMFPAGGFNHSECGFYIYVYVYVYVYIPTHVYVYVFTYTHRLTFRLCVFPMAIRLLPTDCPRFAFCRLPIDCCLLFITYCMRPLAYFPLKQMRSSAKQNMAMQHTAMQRNAMQGSAMQKQRNEMFQAAIIKGFYMYICVYIFRYEFAVDCGHQAPTGKPLHPHTHGHICIYIHVCSDICAARFMN